MDQQVVEQIAQILGSTGSAIINQYLVWHIVQAWSWLLIGIAGLYWAWRFDFSKLDGGLDSHFVRGVLIFLFALAVVVHIPDVAAPRAKAIHQLLQDLPG